MKLTIKQATALEDAFNSDIVRSMESQEYLEYLQLMLSLSLQTVWVSNGRQFVKDFVAAALAGPAAPVVKQPFQHQPTQIED